MRTLPDFDDVYRQDSVFSGVEGIPWNIGEPQPPIAELIDSGQVRGEVLDAGCGVGETALSLAARGYRAVGLDNSPAAIEQAREAATARGLDAEFAVADIADFTGHDGRFSTVLDSTLLHSLPVERRDDYLRAIARASAPGALLHVLTFSSEAQFPDEGAPNTFDESTLRETVARHWTVDEVRPSAITTVFPPVQAPNVGTDDRGRSMLPAFLLSAHLPG